MVATVKKVFTTSQSSQRDNSKFPFFIVEAQMHALLFYVRILTVVLFFSG